MATKITKKLLAAILFMVENASIFKGFFGKRILAVHHMFLFRKAIVYVRYIRVVSLYFFLLLFYFIIHFIHFSSTTARRKRLPKNKEQNVFEK